MAKKRLKTLDHERAKTLLGFHKTLERIKTFTPEIIVTEQLRWFENPKTENEKTPSGLAIFLDRKNREVLSVWLKNDSYYGFKSSAIVRVGTFFQAKPEATEDDCADIIVKGFQQWANLESEFIEEIPKNEWYGEPELYHYP